MLFRLLETLFAFLYPDDGYFLRFINLLHVSDPETAAYAEHAISLISASYIQWGGLNASIAGNGSMAASAAKVGGGSWRQALRSIEAQGVLEQTAADFHIQCEANNTLALYDELHKSWASRMEAQRRLSRALDEERAMVSQAQELNDDIDEGFEHLEIFKAALPKLAAHLVDLGIFSEEENE